MSKEIKLVIISPQIKAQDQKMLPLNSTENRLVSARGGAGVMGEGGQIFSEFIHIIIINSENIMFSIMTIVNNTILHN